MTETVDVFYQETNYVTLLIFSLLIDVCLLLLHVSFIFDCLVYFFSLFCTTCTIFIINNNNSILLAFTFLLMILKKY